MNGWYILGEDFGKLLLRLSLGVLVLLHGIGKITGGLGFVTGVVEKAGLPGQIAWLAYVGEVLAPLMLILGVLPRLAGCIVAINMVVAVLLVHPNQLLALGKTGGYALELEAAYFLMGIVIALIGGGRFGVSGR